LNASMPPDCEPARDLEALAGQGYEDDWEVVIATDGTADIARRYAPRFKAPTVVDSRPSRGHSAPRNAGAKAARGELLVFCDADDVVAPGWLEAMADAARHYGELRPVPWVGS
jgi:glycosyltransferase involved in cell wall biosynthesis